MERANIIISENQILIFVGLVYDKYHILCVFEKMDLLHRGFSPVSGGVKNKRALAINRIKC